MNNACPSCGTLYAVAAKDIGRKLKCKKCNSAMIVEESGLVLLDGPTPTPTASPPPPPPREEVDAVEAEIQDDVDKNDEFEEVVVPKSKKGKKEKAPAREGRSGPDLKALTAKVTAFTEKVGGIPTVLFAVGVFLVIWFTFMSKIGEAAAMRDGARPMKLKVELAAKLASYEFGKDKKPTDEEIKKAMESKEKIQEDYGKRIKEAEEDAAAAVIDNVRSLYYDRWGTMIGFFFVAFGCIGYLRTEQPMVLRIVAGAIITLMMLVVFYSFTQKSSNDLGIPSFGNTQRTGGGMKMGGPGPD